MKKYIVQYNGQTYPLTYEDAVHNLNVFSEVLKMEGDAPNESTIEIVDRLQTIVREGKPKKTYSSKGDVKTHKQPIAPPVSEGFSTFQILGGIAVLLIAHSMIPVKVVENQKAIEPTKAEPLRVIRDEQEQNIDTNIGIINLLSFAGIRIGETANKH